MKLDWYKSLDWFKKTPKVRYVLFVCSGNTCRSPSAEYFFNKVARNAGLGVVAFSRGTEVKAILEGLKARGINIDTLFLEPETVKAIGESASYMKKHAATQVSKGNISTADLVLTVEASVRDKLRAANPDAAYKIFTLKGFVSQNENSSGLDIGNPFMPPPIRKKEGIVEGKVGYYKYIQNYAKVFAEIQVLVRQLIEILYLLEHEKNAKV